MIALPCAQYKDRHNGRRPLDRRLERRVVSNPEIAAKPDDRRIHNPNRLDVRATRPVMTSRKTARLDHCFNLRALFLAERLAKLVEGNVLELTNAFACHPKLLAHFLKRLGLLAI
jgi:hypothetical protein